ncbi:GAF domain-containing protein [Actinacidiphila sp. ITFR-21]|uniref:GAF domain-containing protein n=1 Tax=Actinacidiphila sp. ITFR-21 TaxID=3075199 RepID=UPI00288A03D1|nr:GAF domain-containing protein [Streptomyces sp. ITFR-21]WNI19964.1 GAF domain-containing protein [Streptomyces sp. ITFR-21]
MTVFDTESGLHVTAPDHDLRERTELLKQLRLDDEAIPELDAIAKELGEAAGQPWAMVNFITDQQHFAGLYVAPGAQPVGRSMVRAHGYCPDVLDRPVALILPDVCSHPRFKSNQVVDYLGVRTYAGAPLIHNATGITITLGTVCFIGPEPLPQETGQANRALVNAARDTVMNTIRNR